MRTEPEFDRFPQAGPSTCPYLPPPELSEAVLSTSRVRVTLSNGSKAWLILGHQLARRVLTDSRFSANMNIPGFPAQGTIGVDSKLFEKTMIRRDGPDHRRLRLALSPYFMPSEVNRRFDLITTVITRSLDALRQLKSSGDTSSVDLVVNYARVIPTNILCELLGLTPEMKYRLLQLTPVVFDPASSSEEKRHAFDQLEVLVRELLMVTSSGGPAGSETVRALLRHVSEGRLDVDELAAMLVHLVIAGHHTTGSSLGLILRLVLEHAHLRSAMELSEESAGIVVDEILRYVSVVRGAPRRVALERAEVDGFVFEPGDGVIVALHQANHDPSIFGNPAEIKIDRGNVRQHITFGFGPHQCLGQALARREIVVAARSLLEAFPDMRLSDRNEPVKLEKDNSTISLQHLKVDL